MKLKETFFVFTKNYNNIILIKKNVMKLEILIIKL